MTDDIFDLSGKVAVVTGGYGVLGIALAGGLAAAGASVVLLGRNRDAAEEAAGRLRERGATVSVAIADVIEEDQLRSAREQIVASLGRVDILINAAGGNVARARTDNCPVFELPFDAFDEVVRLNLHGTVYPTLVFAELMADQGKGSVINISSMTAILAISGVVGYSAAKAAIDNFTRWTAVDLAQRHGDGLRVNAIAPGFFITKQNRAVLLNDDGSYTERSKAVIDHTPMGRFGEPDELVGTAIWLASDASSFVTGVVVPVDGGFSVYSGV